MNRSRVERMVREVKSEPDGGILELLFSLVARFRAKAGARAPAPTAAAQNRAA
ncbi:MAG: hypothetical protein AB7P08_04100 [Burkholderiales bacterium]